MNLKQLQKALCSRADYYSHTVLLYCLVNAGIMYMTNLFSDPDV